jgi:hypothetical protein
MPVLIMLIVLSILAFLCLPESLIRAVRGGHSKRQ